jgi:hypothetical protein
MQNAPHHQNSVLLRAGQPKILPPIHRYYQFPSGGERMSYASIGADVRTWLWRTTRVSEKMWLMAGFK